MKKFNFLRKEKTVIILFTFFFLFSILLVSALDVSQDNQLDDVTGVNIINIEPPINYTLVPTVNSSDWWDNLDFPNATQMENSNTELNIKQSWLTSFGNTIWCALTGCSMTGNLETTGNITADWFNSDWVNTTLIYTGFLTAPTLGGNIVITGGANIISGSDIKGASFTIGSDTLDTNEFGFLDGLDQSVGITDDVTHNDLTVSADAYIHDLSITGNLITDIIPEFTDDLSIGSISKKILEMYISNNLYVGLVDLGTNTITDGAMVGDWDFGSGSIIVKRINATDWTNATITESQIDDLVHTVNGTNINVLDVNASSGIVHGNWTVIENINMGEDKNITFGDGGLFANLNFIGSSVVSTRVAFIKGANDLIIAVTPSTSTFGSVNQLEFSSGSQNLEFNAVTVGKSIVLNSPTIKLGGEVHQDDNDKYLFGTGQDASIYFNASDLIIDSAEVGSGGSFFKENTTFEKDVIIQGTLFGGSPVKIDGINVTNNLFMLEENRNSSSRFTLKNLNESSNATAVISAINDVGGMMSIGIGSSNFMIGTKNYQNVTALFSKSRGDMVFANFFNQMFLWLYNPSDDNDPANLVELMRLDEKGLNVSGNITAENVFLPQYIYVHDNATIVLDTTSVWANITFAHEEEELKRGISHTFADDTNHTFTISKDGIYSLDYNFDVIDNSASSTDIDVAGRVILSNGTEIEGSVFETDITKKHIETELSHNLLAELHSGDVIVFQFVADDVDVQISTHGTFGVHPESATIRIEKVANV